MTANRPRLVIGLDFGTTYTGVAFCDSVGKEKGIEGIMVTSEWPGVGHSNEEKVPSRIAYTPPNATVTWGNKARAGKGGAVHACMKLKLDEKRELDGLRRLFRALIPDLASLNLDDDTMAEYPKKSYVDIVADYLTQVRIESYKEMEKILRTVFRTLDKELVVTVPAVWSERARELTRRAVEKAGFEASKISLISEPEAAAIYSLKSLVDRTQKSDVKVNDVFVLVDCGGGTVDLLSYKVTAIEPVFQFEEAAVGCGSKCGASFVDQEFLAWLTAWIGEDRFDKIPLAKKSYGSLLLMDFERNKFAFTGNEDDTLVSLPVECGIDDDDDLKIEDRQLLIEAQQMKEFFEPSVRETLKLIDVQIADIAQHKLGKPKAVFVVGGFGKNKYLYSKIEEHCKALGIPTQQPKNPWSAVVRGAVCRGLELQLPPAERMTTNRRAAKHYGAVISQLFIPGNHHKEDLYTDEHTGMKMARGQCDWMVGKGDLLPEEPPKTMSIVAGVSFGFNEERKIRAMLAGCDENTAPSRYSDAAVAPIGTILGDFTNVPVSRFAKSKSPNGDWYYKAMVQLQATFAAAEMVWCMVHDGDVIGETRLSFD